MEVRARLNPIPGETPRAVLAVAAYLPAIVGAIGWSEEFTHTEYDTVRAGQFSQPAMGKAKQLLAFDDIETLSIPWNPNWLVDPEERPGETRSLLLGLARRRVPFELMLKPKGSHGAPLIRVDVTIRRIAVQQRQGEPDTLYFTLGLKQWRQPTEKRKGTGKAAGEKTHRLTAKDTLYSLAMKYFHSYGAADAIAKANGITKFGKSTPVVKHKRFKVGDKIKIPSIPRASINPPHRKK